MRQVLPSPAFLSGFHCKVCQQFTDVVTFKSHHAWFTRGTKGVFLNGFAWGKWGQVSVRCGDRAYKAQADALGQGPTAVVNAVTALAEKGVRFVPEIMVSGGTGGVVDGLGSELMGLLRGKMLAKPEGKPAPAAEGKQG